MKLKIKPKPADMSPLRVEPFNVKEIITRLKIVSIKFSEGPNFIANLARGGANRIRKKTPISPPIIEDVALIARATFAFPTLAIGNPSRHVITFAPVPGVLIKMELIEPPYTAADQAKINVTRPCSFGIENDIGISKAIVRLAPMPGKMPAIIPTKVPTSIQRSRLG